MKLIISSFAICTFIIGASNNDLNAQEYWRSGYPPAYGEIGGCNRESERMGNRSLELNPYVRNTNYGSNRLPYQAGFGDVASHHSPDGGCGYGGSCNQSYRPTQFEQGYPVQSRSRESGRCPYEYSQLENHSHFHRDNPSRMRSEYEPNYGGNNFDSNHYGDSQSYSAPATRQPEYPQTPADIRPQLRAPAFNPQFNDSANSRTEPNNLQSMPPTSSRIIAPPQLPPQPNSRSQNSYLENGFLSNNNSDFPQRLPPTNSSGTQR